MAVCGRFWGWGCELFCDCFVILMVVWSNGGWIRFGLCCFFFNNFNPPDKRCVLKNPAFVNAGLNETKKAHKKKASASPRQRPNSTHMHIPPDMYYGAKILLRQRAIRAGLPGLSTPIEFSKKHLRVRAIRSRIALAFYKSSAKSYVFYISKAL